MRSTLVDLVAAVYRTILSPLVHLLAGPAYGCRFLPTCGTYATEAFKKHGFARGGWMAFRRVCRCHPWGSSGYDPVL